MATVAIALPGVMVIAAGLLVIAGEAVRQARRRSPAPARAVSDGGPGGEVER